MDIFEYDKKLQQLEKQIKKTDKQICKNAANLKEIQKKHPELKEMCQNYNYLKKEKEQHFVKLIQYLESISDTTLSQTVAQQLNLEKKVLYKMLEQLRE
tara:strand:- start:141 stop:437 length:297 start_codon:yes stop_codon:yes gene_type:complete